MLQRACNYQRRISVEQKDRCVLLLLGNVWALKGGFPESAEHPLLRFRLLFNSWIMSALKAVVQAMLPHFKGKRL